VPGILLLLPMGAARARFGTLSGWGLALLIMVPSYALLSRAMRSEDPHKFIRSFMLGMILRMFATLLAVEIRGEISAGLVSAPALATRWWAARGAGAQRNGKPMRVSGVRDLAHAQAFHGSVGGAEASILPTTWPELLRSTHRQRGFGDFYQHVLVAEGAGEIAFDPALKAWDAAPLAIIAEEAGGAASALDGTRSIYAGSLLTTNGVLHELVRSRLAETAAGTGA